jgi:hypothetical protein
MALRYTSTPYGIAPKQERLPRNAQPMSTAPSHAARPIRVFEPDGRSYVAMHHLGRWQRTETLLDPYSGKHRTVMTGEFVNNPVAWASS